MNNKHYKVDTGLFKFHLNVGKYEASKDGLHTSPFSIAELQKQSVEVYRNKHRAYKSIMGPFSFPHLVILSIINFKMIIFASIYVTK